MLLNIWLSLINAVFVENAGAQPDNAVNQTLDFFAHLLTI